MESFSWSFRIFFSELQVFCTRVKLKFFLKFPVFFCSFLLFFISYNIFHLNFWVIIHVSIWFHAIRWNCETKKLTRKNALMKCHSDTGTQIHTRTYALRIVSIQKHQRAMWIYDLNIYRNRNKMLNDRNSLDQIRSFCSIDLKWTKLGGETVRLKRC